MLRFQRLHAGIASSALFAGAQARVLAKTAHRFSIGSIALFELRHARQSVEAGGAQTDGHAPWIASAVLGFDRLLQRWHGVFEYSSDPLCVLRIQPDIADHSIVLSDRTVVSVGDRILTAHLWNEHVPRMAPGGPTIGWGRRLAYGLEYSLHLLSEYLSRHPEFAGVAAIQVKLMVASQRNTGQLTRIMCHCGFEPMPANPGLSWTERIRQYLDAGLGLLLCIAVNRPAARVEVLRRIRSQMMMSRRLLDQRAARAAAAR